MKPIHRRTFLRQAGLVSLAFGGLYSCINRQQEVAASTTAGFGPLEPDPAGLLSLPHGSEYRIISRAGERMSDGLLVPGRPDGMAAFEAAGGRVLLVRNHENNPEPKALGAFGEQNELLEQLSLKHFYDAGYGRTPGLGGTTTLLYNERSGKVERQFLSLAGTYRNCAGGPTPWGSWLSCEESTVTKNSIAEQDHGFVFEVPASSEPGLAPPRPIKAMGRFNHEALCVDPHTGIVYLTEDRPDSLIYRYLPHDRRQLHAGGRLQALVVTGRPGLDTRNWDEPLVQPGEEMAVAWIDLQDILAPADDLRIRGFEQGAARFARGEGMWYGQGELFFACTNGGAELLGQVFKYVPSPAEGQVGEAEAPGLLSLFVESADQSLLQMCDNLTVAPWGDVILCEDNSNRNYIRGITPTGELYTLACNTGSTSEFAGACFSPSGHTLFVNIQESGETLAITGPFPSRKN